MNYNDLQITEMAGKFIAIGKLFKKRLQVSATFENAKVVDILAYNPENNKNYNVQVKTLQKRNCFPLKKENIIAEHIYIFIILNEFAKEEDFYIIKGSEILKDPNSFFGTSYTREVPPVMPAINSGPLNNYKDNWDLFEE